MWNGLESLCHSCVSNGGMRHRHDYDESFVDSVMADNLFGNCVKNF